MNISPLNLVRAVEVRPSPAARGGAERSAGPLIGQLLVARGAVDPGDLLRALAIKGREEARLGEILLTHRMVSESELYAALAEQWKARIVDLVADPPDPRMIDRLGAETCLKHRMLPWRSVGGATVIVTARPEEFARRVEELPAALRPALMAIAPEADILDALLALRSRRLVRRAETRAPEDQSCRVWNGRRFQRFVLAGLCALAAGHIAAPVMAFAALTVAAALVLAMNMALRVAALIVLARQKPALAAGHTRPPPAIARLPVVSIMVPLFHETAIAERLLDRLGRLTYPRELLDICLVTEDNDETTARTLKATRLPRWLRVVTVPEGTLRTKPRALNYALDFCRGSIIGVYDAEDAPAPDQIHKVVSRFHQRGADVACLQGVLDYYNARSNWMARCFTVEYASWYRVLLPGIEKLGFAVPLGGTTLFLRRSALEKVGGWDAHNVTEDADLGVRLARHGYRTEVLDTVTEEEANSRPWPWVKQRSRWMKGYAMTWAVHMRAPRQLWRDLGPRGFLGVQVLFGGSLLSVYLAPVLWSYWLVMFDLPHPLRGVIPKGIGLFLTAFFLSAYLLNLAVMIAGCRGTKHRHLIPWAFTVELYFPLATLAGLKAMAEMVTRPFYWDKTCHGIDDVPRDSVSALVGPAVAVPAGVAPLRGPAVRPSVLPPGDPGRPALASRIGDWSVRPRANAPTHRV